MRIIAVLLVFIAFVFANTNSQQGYGLNPYPVFDKVTDGGDPGQALFLTPFIRNASLAREHIRKMARVDGVPFLNIESYSGYLTVDPLFNSNMFFWYFPAEINSSYAPVLLWLQGGPGASSMFGLFEENGPFEITESGLLKKRKYSWSATHNLIYIDNPVGSGFSFTDSEFGYVTNQNQVGRYLHEAVMQLYELFEWRSSAGFWISGESYAGKYIPALAYHIHHAQYSSDTRVKIPLKGLAIGNGFSDPIHQLAYGDFLYGLGLIDENGREKYHNIEQQLTNCIEQGDMVCGLISLTTLIGHRTNTMFNNLTGYSWLYNYLESSNNVIGKKFGKFVQTAKIRKALHVGNMTFHDTETCNQVGEHLAGDLLESVAPWIAELLSYYPICVYSGQLDIIVHYSLTRNYLQHLKFEHRDDYMQAPREIWMVDNEIAGYKKKGGNLLEVMVRNAGHMAAIDQPKWVWDLINSFTHENNK